MGEKDEKEGTRKGEGRDGWGENLHRTIVPIWKLKPKAIPNSFPILCHVQLNLYGFLRTAMRKGKKKKKKN